MTAQEAKAIADKAIQDEPQKYVNGALMFVESAAGVGRYKCELTTTPKDQWPFPYDVYEKALTDLGYKVVFEERDVPLERYVIGQETEKKCFINISWA